MEIVSFQVRFQADLGIRRHVQCKCSQPQACSPQPPARNTFTPVALPMHSHPIHSVAHCLQPLFTMATIPTKNLSSSHTSYFFLSHRFFLAASSQKAEIFPHQGNPPPLAPVLTRCSQSTQVKDELQGDPGKQGRTPRIIKLCSLSSSFSKSSSLTATISVW